MDSNENEYNESFDRPPGQIGIQCFCFYCGEIAYRNIKGKWLCEDHYAEYVKKKYSKKFTSEEEREW